MGCADRSAYDLNQHALATGVKLVAQKTLSVPKTIELTEAVPNKAALGKTYRKDTKTICDLLNLLSLEDLQVLKTKLAAQEPYSLAGGFELTGDLVSVKTVKKTVHVDEIIPNVIEPSFGIGRIMYALLEHRFAMRNGDEQRCFLSLPTVVAPIKCTILPLSDQALFQPIIEEICE